MRLPVKNILGVPITACNKQDILENIEKYIKKNKSQISKPLIVFTPNPEIINYAQKDPFFKGIVRSAQINLPDGQGVVWAAKKIFDIQISKIPGSDFIKDLCFLAVKNAATIGLIGGRDGVALKTADCLKKEFPGLKVHVLKSPQIIIDCKTNNRGRLNRAICLNSSTKQPQETKEYFKDLAKKIQKEDIAILFVALGFPKQEYFINILKLEVLNLRSSKPLVLMTVGGAFDYLSGKVKRAPLWMRRGGFEWLYRLVKEPQRIKRQAEGAHFFLKLLSTRRVSS